MSIVTHLLAFYAGVGIMAMFAARAYNRGARDHARGIVKLWDGEVREPDNDPEDELLAAWSEAGAHERTAP